MAKIWKVRPWAKEDVRMLKTLARDKTKTSVIARKLKRSVGATYQQARRLGVTLGVGWKRRGVKKTYRSPFVVKNRTVEIVIV
jgi:hypothetical protein